MSGTAENPTVAECVTALRLSARGDLVAALASLPVPAQALLPGLVPQPAAGRALPAALSLAACSFAAGVLAAKRAGRAGVPAHLAPACAVRLGARCGTIVVFFGGGLALLALVALRLADGPVPADPFLTLACGILLAMLPAVASGSIGCLAGMGGAPRAPVSEAPAGEERDPQPPARRGFMPTAVLTFLLSLASPAVPALLASRGRAPAPPAAAGADPARRDFRYEVPRDLRSAGAARWRVTARLPVPGLFPDAFAIHSADGRHLAFTGDGGSSLVVFDLVEHERRASFGSLPGVRSFAWSPDGGRIFCACGSEAPSFLVLDVGTGSVVRLPLRGGPLHGVPRWRWKEEVGFFAGRRRFAALHLDTLKWDRFGPPPEGEETGAAEELASTDRCSLSVRPRICSLTSPGEDGAAGWDFEADAVLAVTDKLTGASRTLLEEAVQEGTRFLTAPDASRITVVTGGGAVTNYIGLAGEDWAGALAGALPALPATEPGSPLAGLARDGRIGAFVCAPLVNPLNGRVVGPDTSRVRALALFERSGSDRAGLRVAELYRPPLPGDVAGCLHYWDGAVPVLLRGGSVEGWWSQVSPAADPPAGFPAGSDRWRKPELRSSDGWVEFAGWSGSGEPPQEARTALPPSRDELPDSGGRAQARVEAFVREHHAKVGRGDANGFAADYAATVDLRDQGKVFSEFVRRDQAAYQARYERISETVEGPVSVVPTSGGWRASYVTRAFAARRGDGTEFDRRVRITLDLREGGGGFVIERERAADAD